MRIRIAAGLAVMVIAGLGSAFYLSAVESATISITLPAWKLQSFTVVHGAPTGGDFRTQRAQVTLTETATGTATGTVRSSATYATGYVVFNHTCGPNGVNCPPTPRQPGDGVCRINPTGGAWCYVLQAAVTCFCGESVPIRARGPGSSFNAPANTVTTPGWGYLSAYTTVTNPAPITGGADETAFPAVSQSDIDGAAASARAQMSIDLQSALLVKGGGLMHLIPDGAPQVTVTSNVAAGARTNTFQVTATGTLGATEFQDSDAQALIAKAIDRWVPNGYRLNGAPVVMNYQVEGSTEQGDVTVSGEAVDVLVAKFSIDELRWRLRGVSVDAAIAIVKAVAPLSRVGIYLTPTAAPILPLDASRIGIEVTVRPAPAP